MSGDGEELPVGVSEVVLLGHPVAHSRSPVMHNAAFARLELPFVYRALDVLPDDVPATLSSLERAGVVGGNVTVPHKLAVKALCDRLTDEAMAVGAVNTFWWEDEASGSRRLVGDNTDALGLERALREDLGFAPVGQALAGQRVLIVGTGGAASAAALAMERLGASIAIAGRDAGRAENIADLLAVPPDVVLLGSERLASEVAAAFLVVNATSLGLSGEMLPEPFMRLSEDQVAYDLVYGDRPTPFLAAAGAAGAMSFGGQGMLLHQAALAFERWTGHRGPIGMMREALTGKGRAAIT
jgi:shikimate dehydrogenase